MVTLPNGEGFRAYYRGLPELSPAGVESEVTAYAESVDGIHWTKPENNIVLRDAAPVTHNFTIYYDQKSGIPVAEKWKGIGGTLEWVDPLCFERWDRVAQICGG